MRVMLMFKGDPEPGAAPSEELLAAMGRYNDELKKAGVLLDLAGLHPSAEGRRVKFSGGNRTLIDGPFAGSKELIAGYWILQVKSMDEAVEWAKRFPFSALCLLTIEHMFEYNRLAMLVQDRSALPDLQALVGSLRDAVLRLEPDYLSTEEATGLVKLFAEVERLGAAGRTLMARQVERSGVWKAEGHRSAAH